MLQMATAGGNKYYPIPRDEGFIFTANREENGVIRNVPDQYYIHNVKKLINILLHARLVMVGPYLAHLNQLEQVRTSFLAEDHGLTQLDLTRDDRQNYRNCEKVCGNRVRACLQRLIEGNNPFDRPCSDLKGLYLYLTIVAYYIEIFLNPTRTLAGR